MFYLLKTFNHPVEVFCGLSLLVCGKVRREFPEPRLKLSLLGDPGPPPLHHRPAQLQKLLHPALQLLQALLVLPELLAEPWRVPEALSIVYQGRRHDFPCWHSRFVYFDRLAASLFPARAAFELIKDRSKFQFSCAHLLPCVRFSGAGCSCCDSVSCPLTEQLLLLQPAPSYLPWLLSYSHTFLLSALMQLQLSAPNICITIPLREIIFTGSQFHKFAKGPVYQSWSLEHSHRPCSVVDHPASNPLCRKILCSYASYMSHCTL